MANRHPIVTGCQAFWSILALRIAVLPVWSAMQNFGAFSLIQCSSKRDSARMISDGNSKYHRRDRPLPVTLA